MGHHLFTARCDAPREDVFDLWVNMERAHEWIEGLTHITDVTGPFDRPGTRYTAWFGRMRNAVEILDVDRPRLITTRFESRVLRGVTQAAFQEEDGSTLITEDFWTQGFVPGIVARIFATGSYRGSFRGELNSFVRLAERETRQQSTTP